VTFYASAWQIALAEPGKTMKAALERL